MRRVPEVEDHRVPGKHERLAEGGTGTVATAAMQDPIAQDADGVGPARETRLGGTAVVLDQHPLWLDAVGRLLEQLAITSVSKVTRPSQALAAILEQRPALFVLDTDVEGDEPNALECVRQAC